MGSGRSTIAPPPDRDGRRGLTLVELLAVVLVVLLLLAMTYPILNRIRSRADLAATTALVQGVAAQVGTLRQLTARDGRSVPAWTLGQRTAAGVLVTTEIDGDPDAYPADDPSPLVDRAPAGYHGFFLDTHATWDARTNAKGQLLDRWHRPLQIDYDPKRFGASGVGVWSLGPDGRSDYPLDSGASRDDVRSWGDPGG